MSAVYGYPKAWGRPNSTVHEANAIKAETRAARAVHELLALAKSINDPRAEGF